MKKKLILGITVMFIAFLTAIPVAKAADPIVSVNGQDTYETFAEALAVVGDGDSIELIANVDLAEDLTIPEGVTFRIMTNTLTITDGYTLTIMGNLVLDADGTIINQGNLTLEGTSLTNLSGTITNQKNLTLRASGTMNIYGNLDCAVNSKILSDTNDGATININSTGAITGNASIFDTATKILFNNYGGRLSDAIAEVLPEGYYNYYPLYNGTDTYYKTFDELTSGMTVSAISNITVNGNTTIPTGVIVNVDSGVVITVNGSFTVNGTLNLTNGYSPVVANYLFGIGTVYLNAATEMVTSYWTYVNILDDVSTTLVFEAQSGYNPAIGDVLFELGTDEDSAIMIAAKINLGESFEDFVINPQATALNTPYGYALGVVADAIVDEVNPAPNPETGNSNFVVLGLLSISALLIAGFCARKMYILNRI